MGIEKQLTRLALLSIWGSWCAGSALAESFDETVEKALQVGGGKINFDIRYRYELVDQANFKEDANADTIRVKLGYLTPEFYGFKFFAEYEGNQDVFSNDYNSTRNHRGLKFPIVADPQANEVNQLWLSYGGLPKTLFKAGRQRIIYDNHRFVGNVIWRQLEQTYDSVTIANTSLPDTTVQLGYIWNIQDIFSRTVGMNSPIFNIAYAGWPYGKLIVHGEFLDFDSNNDQPPFQPLFNSQSNSTETVGLRFDGAAPITEHVKALYTMEYARQSEYGDNPKKFDVDYWLADAGVDLWGVTLRGAYERLGADNGQGFRTPLSTLHAFQGWADKFLVTPPNGIQDVNGTLKTQLFGVDLWFVYHDFRDANNEVRYGDEFDIQVEKKFGKHYSLLFKYADYNAVDRTAFVGNIDTQRLWVQGSVSFQ